ncbi:hypothetical protein AVL61_16730 [Kocuria rosea subsp. polaris]|uniref:Uncharacterized protein n=1 Tax=Kocuria rosea subsp. polaris TaxID=136273 RepID=A0A0W8I903_KOCRO|nr:hypothetical protein [Kocuria polaris]KUG56288.1 hypothetical protein AVL61_16730 [Kocuria polaris]
MSAKKFTVFTFGTVVIIALAGLTFMLIGVNWQGGSADVSWVLLGMSGMSLGSLFVYQRKGSLAKVGARQLLAVERGLTLDQALEAFRKYSFLLFISACSFSQRPSVLSSSTEHRPAGMRSSSSQRRRPLGDRDRWHCSPLSAPHRDPGSPCHIGLSLKENL